MAANEKIKDSLISEYDQIISELQQQIQLYQVDAESLKRTVKSVTDENERLHQDLQKAFQLMESPGLQQLKDNDANTDILRQASIELEEAQRNEREKALKLSQSKKDLIALKREFKLAQQSIVDLQEANDKLHLENQQSVRTAKNFHLELTSLREELNQCQKQLKHSTVKNVEVQSLLDSTRQQLMKKSKELTSICMKENSSDQRVSILQATNNELESKLSKVQAECSQLAENKMILESTLSSLQEKTVILESREHAAVDHVRESMQLLEAALAEKEQADLKEQHYISEIRHLQKKVSVLLDEAGSRARSEIEKVRDECNKNIDIMAAEIEQLERQCGEKQSQVEKMQREKDELNKELHKINSAFQCPQEQPWVKDTLNDIRSKLLLSEKSKDEVLLELKSLQSIKSKIDASLLEEKQKSAYLEQDLTQQRKQYHSDCQQFRHEIGLLTGKCKVFQEQITELTQKMQEAEKEHKRMASIAYEERLMIEKELKLKLKCAEDNQQKMATDFKQHMLTHQQATNRWKKDTSDLHSKFEKSLLDINLKLVDSKAKNKELTSKLHKLAINNKAINTKLSENEQTISKINERLSETEALAEQRRQQISLLVARERKALKEKQDLHRLLHKARFQMAQSLNVADTGLIGIDSQVMCGSKLGDLYSSHSAIFDDDLSCKTED